METIMGSINQAIEKQGESKSSWKKEEIEMQKEIKEKELLLQLKNYFIQRKKVDAEVEKSKKEAELIIISSLRQLNNYLFTNQLVHVNNLKPAHDEHLVLQLPHSNLVLGNSVHLRTDHLYPLAQSSLQEDYVGQKNYVG